VDIEQQIVSFATKDLQTWMANVGKETTEASVTAWQQGYIAGVQRAMSIREESEVEEI
jgi:hypothetical protein